MEQLGGGVADAGAEAGKELGNRHTVLELKEVVRHGPALLGMSGKVVLRTQGAAEREAVWMVARNYAQQYGLTVPTMAQVQLKERLATGHID